MNKNAIKKYAVWARRELIARVTQKAQQFGITEDRMVDVDADSIDGRLLTHSEKKQRAALISKIRSDGFEQTMEAAAYTWFNRFCALRFMEVNNYLPSRVRVFTDAVNNFKPQIIDEALDLDIDGLSVDVVINLKQANKTEELYKYLLITQCNALGKILPGMFQKIDDWTELLFPDYILREGSVIHALIAEIPEEDWNISTLDENGNPQGQVQIIGWLYQYYNSEPKDKVFENLKKNIKISKDDIPAATQLFTPDWIVRYMVENSLGRLVINNLKYDIWSDSEKAKIDVLKSKWKYYLEEAEQEPEVEEELRILEHHKYASGEEEIFVDAKFIDPCMGSGHILVYAFDVFMDIYKAQGWPERDAALRIVNKNLWGLDIDDRAAQLAYFAVMMKARQYDRNFFKRGAQPHIYAIKESGHFDKDGRKVNSIDPAAVDYFVDGRPELKEAIDILLDELFDAKEYGSILNVTNVDFDTLYARFDEIFDEISLFKQPIWETLLPLVQVAQTLAQKYDVVVTNPPYMGKMPSAMTSFVQDIFPQSKYDLYAVFIEQCIKMANPDGYIALITQHTWMFISSFELLRKQLMQNSFISLLHLGPHAFETIGGEVVQTVAMVINKHHTNKFKITANRLVDYTEATLKEQAYLRNNNRHETYQNNFKLLPGNPFVYWLSNHYFDAFSEKRVEEYVERKAGVVTGQDSFFLRLWYEAPFYKISFSASSSNNYAEYHIMSKGGSHRRYYGNYEYVIRLRDLWNPDLTNVSVRRGDSEYYFKKAIGWSQVGNSQKSFRYIENSVCGTATPTIYLKNDIYFNYILAMLNTKIAYEYLTAYNPTINLLTTDVCNIPLPIEVSLLGEVNKLCSQCIEISKIDWDSYETSWDFKLHPLIAFRGNYEEPEVLLYADDLAEGVIPVESAPISASIAQAFDAWERFADKQFNQLKANEEELNRIFIKIYGLQDELTPEVEDKDVTVRKADLQRDIKSLISYAVGCMFGRYSLDVDGLAYASGEWDSSKYRTYPVDNDNIIPICDDEYFEDDIVGRFVQFIATVYGDETLEENLKFISDALGGKGTPREVIRNYFLNDFYADHLKIYQKRPIYWLFDSGKKNGFKALIYMHRYREDTIARMRTDYIHEQQARYRTAIGGLEQRIANASGGEAIRLNKQLTKLKDQATEIRLYEEKIHHLADQMIRIDLDDGVKHNYEIFKDVLAKLK